ncbi:8921_t:CDS:10, partial [Rhizophagus irregularis]
TNYSNLTLLYDLLQSSAHDIDLIKKDDEEEYKHLLRTTIVSSNTCKDFSLITKEKQEIVGNIRKEQIVNRHEPIINIGRFGFTKSNKSIIENPKGYRICALNTTTDLMKKSYAWLKLYTRIGQEALCFLLTNYSIFLELKNGCYIQIMGPSISRKCPIEDLNKSFKAAILNDRKIIKALIYNKNGELWHGLPKNHILNVVKFSYHNVNMSNTVISYIFPKQFNLKNVFTCREVSHALYYTYMDRRKEIDNLHCKIPDYLKHLLPYIDHIIKRHNICQYRHLLNTYCPIQETSLVECNTYQVKKFVVGVLDFIFPPEFFGDKNNKTVIYNMISVFIEKRHSEVVSLHEVVQNFKIKKCQWLKGNNNLEILKCTEMLYELIWWIFECLVIPLLKEKNPSLLTGSIFNYNEVHACLKEYKKHLSNDDNPRLYFAKVDIKCCFETIDQNILMEIIEKEVLTEYQYSVNKFEAIYLKGGTIYRKRDNFVHDSIEDVLELLKEHIQQNIIKVNEEYYKQKVSIPQGLVLSSLLCSIYYGVMEREEFKYIINDTNGLLLHFLDDFLYISTNKNNVIKFITTMHQDDLKYKIVVNDKKSMVNFDLTVNNNKINKVDGYEFPWCGILIDTRNLDVKVDYSRYSDLSR